MNKTSKLMIWIVFSIIVGSWNAPLIAEERAVSVLLDWLSNEEVRQYIELTKEQEQTLLIAVQRVRIGLDEVLASEWLPNYWEGPRSQVMADQLVKFHQRRTELYAEFEDLLFKVLRPDQGDKLLGRLVRASGPRSVLESSYLRKRMKLTANQQQDIEAIYFGFEDLWEEVVHEGDQLRFIKDVETMKEFSNKPNSALIRLNRLLEKIWDIDKEMTKEAQKLDEEAMRVLTPEQKLLLDSLREKGAPNP